MALATSFRGRTGARSGERAFQPGRQRQELRRLQQRPVVVAPPGERLDALDAVTLQRDLRLQVELAGRGGPCRGRDQGGAMSRPRSESEYLARLIPPSVAATGMLLITFQ